MGSGATVAGGADAMDGDGEGCEPVAVVAEVGSWSGGDPVMSQSLRASGGTCGGVTEGQLWLCNWEMRSKVARPLWHVPLGFCWGGS